MRKKTDVEEDLEVSGHCMTITSLSPAKKSPVKHYGYSPQKQALQEQYEVFLKTREQSGAPSETEIARRIHASKAAIRKKEIAAEERIRHLEEQCKKQAAELEAIKAAPVHDMVELGALPPVDDVRVRELEEQVQRERAETTRLNEAHARELEEKRVLAIAHEQDVLATETARLNIEHEQTLAALRVQLTAEKREELRTREGELTAAYALELAKVRAAAIAHEQETLAAEIGRLDREREQALAALRGQLAMENREALRVRENELTAAHVHALEEARRLAAIHERELLAAETERLNEAHARALVEAREIAVIHEREALAAEIGRLDREREQALAALRGQLAMEREEQLRIAREAATRAFDVEHTIRVRTEQEKDAAALLATQRQATITQLQQQLAAAPLPSILEELEELREWKAKYDRYVARVEKDAGDSYSTPTKPKHRPYY